MASESEKKHKTSKSRRETAVQGTNDSSIVSKCSMAALGYFDDPFLPKFVNKVTRRAPLIHRGYYVRAKTLDFLLKKFLNSYTGRKQIISLGAGFDSAFFRLTSQGLLDDTLYCEVDFPDVVKRKFALIKADDVLFSMLDNPDSGKDKSPLIEVHSKKYNLLGVDLSQINTLEAVLKLCGVDFDVPTLLLSEIVLAYMTKRSASRVVRWAAETFTDSVFILYEQINPNDPFGLFMQKHYKVIGSPLKCLNSFPTIQSQIDRFTKLGWKYFEALDMNQFYQELIPAEERGRVEHLEPFDEYEEWHLKCNHYMMLCAYQKTEHHLLSHIKEQSEATPMSGCEYEVHEGCIDLSSAKSPVAFKRFGHVTSRIESDWLMCLGGFGNQQGKHMRVTDITFINSTTLEVINIDPKVNNREIEVSRMHSTACLLKDDTVMLIGGRVSPMRLCTQMVEVMVNCGKPGSNLENTLNISKSTQSSVKKIDQKKVNSFNSNQNCDKENLNFTENTHNQYIENLKTPETGIADVHLSEPPERPTDESSDSNIPSVCMSDKGDISAKNTETAGIICKDNVAICDINKAVESGNVEKMIPNVDKMIPNVDKMIPNVDKMIPNVDKMILNVDKMIPNVDKMIPNVDKMIPNVDKMNCAENSGASSEENCDKTADVDKDEIGLEHEPCNSKKSFSVNCSVVKQEGELPCPRWRHTAIVIEYNGEERIILFGGRTQDVLALGDCFSFHTETKIWTKITSSSAIPLPRHSHTASFWNGHMIIAGGLGDDLQPLNCVYMLNLETFKWHKLDCKIPPRYSHTAFIKKDFLVLIGGVSLAHRLPGVTMIHLPTARCMEFSLPAANADDLIMLHRHTSVAIDNNRIMVLGGGGNCFSFGTHLNSSPLIMDLTKAFQMVEDKMDV